MCELLPVFSFSSERTLDKRVNYFNVPLPFSTSIRAFAVIKHTRKSGHRVREQDRAIIRYQTREQARAKIKEVEKVYIFHFQLADFGNWKTSLRERDKTRLLLLLLVVLRHRRTFRYILTQSVCER